MPTWIKRHPALSWMIGSYLFFTLATAGVEFSKLDVRFAYIMQEMSGHPLGVFPKIHGVPYADYFSPFFLLVYLTTLGGRFISMWSMSQPSMLLGSLTIGLTCLAGEKLAPRAGHGAAAILLCGFEYVCTVCQFGMDMSVAAACALMLYALVTEPDRWRTCGLFALLTVLAILFRGSLGLLVFGGAVAGWLLADRHWARVGKYALAGVLAAAVGAGTVFALIHWEGGRELWRTFLDWQVGKRVAGGDFKFYWWDGFFSFAPGTFIALFGLIRARKAVWRSPILPLLGFLCLPLFVLSFPGGKHLRYIVPLLPAGALAGAYALTRFPVRDFSARLLRFLGFIPFVGLGIIAAAAGIVPFLPVEFPLPWGHLAVAATLFLGLIRLRPHCSGWTGAGIFFTLCALTVYCGIAIPMVGESESARKFVTAVEAKRTGRVLMYRLHPDHEALKYLVWTAADRRADLICVSSSKNVNADTHLDRMYPNWRALKSVLPELRDDDVFVVRDKYRKELLRALKAAGRDPVLIQPGQLGHRRYMAYRVGPRRQPSAPPPDVPASSTPKKTNR